MKSANSKTRYELYLEEGLSNKSLPVMIFLARNFLVSSRGDLFILPDAKKQTIGLPHCRYGSLRICLKISSETVKCRLKPDNFLKTEKNNAS